jgi:catechol 2,3-dioxygenase
MISGGFHMNDLAPSNPDAAVTPVGLNHLVLNVRDIEASHRFWTEMLGFHQVGEVPPRLGGVQRGAMRFYSGVRDGRMHHHDIALVDTPDLAQPEGPNPIGHVAIALPDRESWLRQLAFLQNHGVAFERRVEHGMTHSLYIREPNGYSVELLYELPRETWEGDINAALNHYVALPTEGSAALEDRAEYPAFG